MKTLTTARRQIELLARDPLLAFLVGLLFLSLTVFVVYPLAAVLARSFQNEQGSPSLENYVRFLRYGYLWSALWNSVLVGAVTAGAGVILGYAAAFALVRTKVRAKKLLHVLFILPII
jgi:iron(III) transport system permease protein